MYRIELSCDVSVISQCSKLSTLLAAILAIYLPPIGASASITLLDNADCTFVLEGNVAAGDADQLLLLVDPVKFERPTMCLNSHGGSFSEAIKIIDAFSPNMRTKIRANKECLSACALIFLAGRQYRWIGSTVPDRWLHKTARLGFHAPYAPVDMPDPRAFAAGVRAIAALISRSSNRDGQKLFPTDLLAEALKVNNPDKYFEIEWIHQAIRWNIGILDADVSPDLINGCIVARACINYIWQTSFDVDYERSSNTEFEPIKDSDFPFDDLLSLKSNVSSTYAPKKTPSWFDKSIRFSKNSHRSKLGFVFNTKPGDSYICSQEISKTKYGLIIDMKATNDLGQVTTPYDKDIQGIDYIDFFGINSGVNKAYLLDPRKKIQSLNGEAGMWEAIKCKVVPDSQ